MKRKRCGRDWKKERKGEGEEGEEEGGMIRTVSNSIAGSPSPHS